jgi:hypothetical protein
MSLGVVQGRGRAEVTLALDGPCDDPGRSWSLVFERECEVSRLRLRALGRRGLSTPRFDDVEARVRAGVVPLLW